jgi:hypothetical protein
MPPNIASAPLPLNPMPPNPETPHSVKISETLRAQNSKKKKCNTHEKTKVTGTRNYDSVFHNGYFNHECMECLPCFKNNTRQPNRPAIAHRDSRLSKDSNNALQSARLPQ